MKDIHEVLRRKQAKYAQLAKQIELLQQVADKLREVAPLLAENDEEDSTILPDLDAPSVAAAAASTAATNPPSAAKPTTRPGTQRWP
jgi:cell division septum initiation protein DivIVA